MSGGERTLSLKAFVANAAKAEFDHWMNGGSSLVRSVDLYWPSMIYGVNQESLDKAVQEVFQTLVKEMAKRVSEDV